MILTEECVERMEEILQRQIAENKFGDPWEKTHPIEFLMSGAMINDLVIILRRTYKPSDKERFGIWHETKYDIV